MRKIHVNKGSIVGYLTKSLASDLEMNLLKHVRGIIKENNIVFDQKTLTGLSSLSLVDDSLDSQSKWNLTGNHDDHDPNLDENYPLPKSIIDTPSYQLASKPNETYIELKSYRMWDI